MKGSILPSVLLSCTVFSCLTLPLVALGSQPIQIEVQKEQIFVGKLKDIAPPYLGVAGLISLGAGAISLSIAGWRQSSRKSSQFEGQLSALEQQIKGKDAVIEELKLSTPHLAASGLDAFIAIEAHAGHRAFAGDHDDSSAVDLDSRAIEAVKPLRSMASEPIQSMPAPVNVANGSAKVASLSAPDPFVVTNEAATAVSRLTPNSYSVAQTAVPMPMQPSDPVLEQVSELHLQLKQMAAHVENLQSSLQTSSAKTYAHATDSSSLVIEHLHRRLQQLESRWGGQQAAS